MEETASHINLIERANKLRA